MSNLVELQSQIEKLQKQAQDIRVKEFDKTVQEILAKMSAFGITVKDLKPGKPARRGKASVARKPRVASGKVKSKRSGTVVPPKFRGPNGETWSGRGLMPRWLSALVAQGRSKEQFAVAG